MSHFWNWLIEYIPRWIAPNVLTLLGLLSMVCAFLTLYQYCPDGFGYAPSWVYAAEAFWIFLYQALDNLDGKQARRTGSSSALGELFDHGADAFTVGIFAFVLGTSFQFGPVLTFAFGILLMATFFLAHWESHFTGVLLLRTLANPVETQCLLMAILLGTAYFGPQVWVSLISLPVFGPVQLNSLWFGLMVLSFLANLYDNVTTTTQNLRSRSVDTQQAFAAFAPFAIFAGVALFWAETSGLLLFEYTTLFVGTIGLVFAHLQIRLILSGILKEHWHTYYSCVTPLVAGLAYSSLARMGMAPIASEYAVLVAVFLAVLAHDCFLVYYVVTEMASTLGIRVFHIVPTLPSTTSPKPAPRTAGTPASALPTQL